MLISIISFVIVFSIVTLSHEFGHFIFSRRAGIKVLEMGLGFGPKLFCLIKEGTLYTINLFPLGGFIRIAGIDPSEEHKDEKYSLEQSYISKNPKQKFMSIFGGPVFNLILAFIIFYAMYTITGVPKDISNEIATIAPASPAHNIGLRPGDRILAMSGEKITKMADAVSLIHKSAGKQIVMTIDRHGKTFTVKAIPRLNKKLNIGLIGFSLKPIYARTNPFNAFYESAKQVFISSALIIYTIGLLIVGKVSLLDLAGPVGIAQFTGQVAGEGIVPLLSFTAFLSINLGIINLLPIPALDGGRIVFILIEAVRKKAVDIELENKIHHIGLIALLSLMAVVTTNDIFRIFKK